jgi:hypothetical protein
MTWRRGVRLFIAPLAVAALMAACNSSADHESFASDGTIDWDRPTPAADAQPETAIEDHLEQSDQPIDPANSRADSVTGLYDLSIPKLDIAAPVVAIESNEDRVLLPPRDPGIVGWWSQGAEPGAATGSAIMVGHSVSTGGGALNEIADLAPGDEVDVSGQRFRVQSVDVLSYEDVARQAESLFSQSVAGRLVIVTCEDWNGRTWNSNVITIAVPV